MDIDINKNNDYINIYITSQKKTQCYYYYNTLSNIFKYSIATIFFSQPFSNLKYVSIISSFIYFYISITLI